MLLWKVSQGINNLIPFSFNPCSLGCCSEREEMFVIGFLRGMFQSLFSWMLLWKVHISDSYVRYTSFNPCSLGCCSESISSRIIRPSVRSCFNPCSLGCCSESFPSFFPNSLQARVSILVLLDVALKDRFSFTIITDKIMFQSLFSWMLLWKTLAESVFHSAKLFQSLFSWMLLWKKNASVLFVGGTEVSILVLLDVALKEYES